MSFQNYPWLSTIKRQHYSSQWHTVSEFDLIPDKCKKKFKTVFNGDTATSHN